MTKGATMKRTIKAEYDGKHFTLTAENCNAVELLSFVCDVAEQTLCIIAGNDTELFDEAKETLIDEIKGMGTLDSERVLQ